MKTKYTAIIEKTNDGFTGYFKDLDGIASAGDSIEEIKSSLREALGYQLEYLNEKVKKADSIEDVEIEYMIDLEQFFEYYNMINKSAFAEYIGLNKSLFRQYTKGLVGISDKKLFQITEGLHRLGQELNDVVLVNN